MSKPSSFFTDVGVLNKRHICLTVFCLIMVTLWNTSSIMGAPAKLDLQPPVFEAASTPYNGDNNGKTLDSYGNPIESLQPIDTPDGRKVVSAQGLQFEIPNYASGITELKKPTDDLLPPFVGELSNDLDKTTTTTTTTSVNEGHEDDNDANNNNDNKTTTKDLSSRIIEDSLGQPHMLRIERQPKLQQQNYQQTDQNNNNNILNINALQEQQQLNDQILINHSNTNTNVAFATTNKPNQHITIDQHEKLTTPHSPLDSSVTNSLSLFVNKQINKSKSLSLNSQFINPSSATSRASASSAYSPLQFTTNHSLKSPSSKSKLSAPYAPLSNGNFNYPNIPTDLSIIERIASKYKNPLPTLDPIVVAIPDDSTDTPTTYARPSSAETTTVDVESVPLLEIQTETTKNSQFEFTYGKFQGLPQYMLDLNDPNIAGPVDYISDNKGLKVLAWDLLPPYKNNVENVQDSGSLDAQATQEQDSVVDLQTQHSQTSHVTQKPHLGDQTSLETTTKPNFSQQNRGNVYYSSTTTRPTTTTTTRRTTTTTTTTTPRPTTTTTPRTTTTTTRRTTTPWTKRTTTTTTTTEAPDTSEFYKLEAGDSYTLPTWLQDIDDPELDVAVAYVVPSDINEYNQTIDRDILPPFEPYTDLNNLHVTTPSTKKEVTSTTTPRSTTTTRRTTTTTTTTARPTTTTTTTTTTRQPTLSTSRPQWIRAKPTIEPTISTVNNQFTTSNFNHNQDSVNHAPSIVSSNFAQRTTTSTTVKPKTTVNYYNRPLSNTLHTDNISSGEALATTPQKSKNPFLPSYNDGSYRPQSTTRRTTTTTTTTTVSPKVDRNPFVPTIPPWLKDFDYPDLGPGVPFVYDPNEDESPVDKDILPPNETTEINNNKPTFIASPASTSSTSFVNSQTPQGFTNKFSNSATSFITSSSIPSKVTIPHPSTQQTNQDDSTVSQPPLVFVPPAPTAASDVSLVNADAFNKKTSSSFNTNFAAPFDPTGSDNSKKIPLGADRESFPPFNNVVSGGTTSKTTFSKSEDGKVITKNVFLNGGGSASSKPFAVNNAADNQQKDTLVTQSSTQFGVAQGFSGSSFNKATTASTSFKQFGTTAAGASGFVTSGASASTFGATTSSSSSAGVGSKYTGRFGGPPGVLAPQSSGFTTATPVTTSYYRPAATTVSFAGAASTNNYKFTGSFGGPPGVLQPYDNVQKRN